MVVKIKDGRTLEKGQRVDVYRNLHSQQLFSIRDVRTRLVAGKGTRFYLINVEAVISASGQVRARREQQRNVHGVLRGSYQGETESIATEGLREIYYNPFTTDTFILRDTGEVFTFAACVYFDGAKAWLVE